MSDLSPCGLPKTSAHGVLLKVQPVSSPSGMARIHALGALVNRRGEDVAKASPQAELS